ncbi:hypothetical protein D9M68_971130 [compost metagenome]
MIDPDFTELIDNDRGIGEFGQLKQMIQGRGFATAEETGQQRDRYPCIDRIGHAPTSCTTLPAK